VEHRVLGSLFGSVVGRQGKALLLRLDDFDGVQRVRQQFVSDAEGDVRDEQRQHDERVQRQAL
jgi:hypothetical protein